MILSKLFKNKDRQEEQERISILAHFDTSWYQKRFNIDKNDIEPIIHFCKYGVYEFKNPNKHFDIRWYLNEYKDVAQNKMNPFYHYIVFGKKEGRFQNQDEKDLYILKNNALEYFKTRKNELLNLNRYGISTEECLFIQYLKKSKRGGLKHFDISEKIKLLSLDIWDTVLRRKCHPDEIKLSASRFLYINYYWYLKPAYRDNIALYKSRKKSEDGAAVTKNFEYRYEDAINIWLPMVFETGMKKEKLIEVKEKLIKQELDAELRSTVKDFAMDQFLKKNKFTQIIFASDFYMPSEFINKLLQKNGVSHHFISGYSSCELFKNKRSGNLFDHIIEEFKVNPNEVLHIGDNKHADVEVPSKKGISTFYYDDEQENKINEWFKKAFEEKLEGVSTRHSERILFVLENLAKTEFNELRQIGIRFAPVAIGYILHIIEEAKKFDVETIYFFTREGIFLKELYDLVVGSNPYYSSYPNSEILEVSRLSTFAPSLEKIDISNLMGLWNQYSKQTPKAFCKSLNIDSKDTENLFRSFGFTYEKKIQYPWKNKKFVKLLESRRFKTIVDNTVSIQKDLMKKYFQQKGLNGRRSVSMIVDLGWRGTIQDNVAHLLDEHVHGCYLGLFKYLNKQIDGVSKSGWLFDNNIETNDWDNEEVGPIEMMFNALGGSAVGYKEEDGKIVAIKKEESSEDKVFDKYTVHFQSGIKLAINELIDYIAIHALTAENLKEMSRKIVRSILENPPSIIAEAFFNLTHNETFGTGVYQKMEIKKDFIEGLISKQSSSLYTFVKDYLEEIRWKEGFLNLKTIQKGINSITTDLSNVPLDFYKKIILKNKHTTFKVAIYAPGPLVGSGGHRTLFNLAKKFAKAGCEVYCFLEETGDGMDAVYEYLGEEKVFVHLGWPLHMEFDMAVATIAHSAQAVANLKNVKHKAYLVQDFEAWFNPVGDAYTINENSYTHGLLHFTVGKFLSHVLHSQYGAKAIPSGLGIDTKVYFDKDDKREKAISFLYQPEKDRRNPQLSINALRIVKEKEPKTKIYVYGSDASINLDFEVENLGLVRDLNKLNDLYNKCKVGLCISMSNPSRIPFEFMASGVVPVDVYRYNNLLDYPTGSIKLAYQSSASIAKAILELLENEDEFKNRKNFCKAFATTRTLEWEMDTFVNNALSVMNGLKIDNFDVKCEYNEEPVLAENDNRKEVITFCNWQKKLATNSI